MVGPGALVLVVAAVWGLCAAAPVELKDGNIIRATATSTAPVVYMFQQEYEYGDFSVMFWDEGSTATEGYVRLQICHSENCNGETPHTLPGWGVVNWHYDETNFWVGTYYLVVEAAEGVSYGICATGAPVVAINEERVLSSAVPMDVDSDGYINFRTFLCDLETAILAVSIPGKTGSNVFYNHWDKENSDPSKAIGKPREGYCDGSQNAADISDTGNGHVPGWVWASVYVGDLSTTDGITILANTEPSHDSIAPGADVESEVCIYEDCLEIFRVDIADFSPNHNISVVVTPTENQVHNDANSIFKVSYGTVNPPSGSRMTTQIISWSKESWEQIPIYDPNAESVYFALYTSVDYKFPTPVPYMSVPYSASVHMDAVVVNVGGRTVTSVLEPISDPTSPYTFSKSVILNTVSYRYPVSLDDMDVHADYIFQAYVDDDSVADNVDLDMFGGMFGQPTVSGTPTNTGRKGSAEIRFQHDEAAFFKTGVYNITTTTVAHVDAASIPVSFYGALSYYVDKDIEYLISGIGSEATDHFTTVELDPEQEYTFYVTAYDYGTETPFTLYGSTATAFPGEKFHMWSGTNNNFAALHIPKGGIATRSPLYVTIDTLYKGEIMFKLMSGENQEKHIGPNESVEGTIAEQNTPSTIIYHSSKNNEADVVVVRVSIPSTYTGTASLTACIGAADISDDSCMAKMTVRKNLPTAAARVPKTNGGRYFIRLESTSSDVKVNNIPYSVFAEDAIQLKDSTKKMFDISNPEGTFFYVSKKSTQDMQMTVTVNNPPTGAVAYDAVICGLYPSASSEDVGAMCTKQSFSSGGDPEVLLASVDDETFKGSSDIYVSLYPVIVRGSVSAKVVLYLDTHMDIGKMAYFSGQPGVNAYYKVHIERGHYSPHTLFELTVVSEYKVSICASEISHPRVNSADCLTATSWIPNEGTEQDQLEYYFDITDTFGFDFNRDQYIFFTVLFPDVTVGNTHSAALGSNLIAAVQPSMELPYDYTLTGLVHQHFYVYDLATTPVWGVYVRRNIEADTFSTIPPDFFNQETQLVMTTDDSTPAPHWSNDCEMCTSGSGVQYFSLVGRNFQQSGHLYISSFLASQYGAIPIEYQIAFANFESHVPQALSSTQVVTIGPENATSFKFFSYLARNGDNFDTVYVWPCAGEPSVHWSYMAPNPSHKDNTHTLHEPFHTSASWRWGEPYSFVLKQQTGEAFPHDVNVFLNVTGSDATLNQRTGRWAAILSINQADIGPTVINRVLQYETDGAGVTVKFSPASPKSAGAVAVEYALYAMPAPSAKDSTFDPNPNVACGMTHFGQPLYKDGDRVFVSLSGDSLTIKSNIDPNKIDFAQSTASPAEKNLYNINIIARDVDAQGTPLQETAYNVIMVELVGSMPGVTDWWEWLLLVIGVVAAVALIAFFVWWWLHKKNASKRYDAMLAEANNDQSLNVEDSERAHAPGDRAAADAGRPRTYSDSPDLMDEM